MEFIPILIPKNNLPIIILFTLDLCIIKIVDMRVIISLMIKYFLIPSLYIVGNTQPKIAPNGRIPVITPS